MDVKSVSSAFQSFRCQTIRWQDGDQGTVHPFYILVLNNIALERPLNSGVFSADMNGAGVGGRDIKLFTSCAEYLYKSVFGKLPGQCDQMLGRSMHASKVKFHSMYISDLIATDATAFAGEEVASGTGMLTPRRTAVSGMLNWLGVNPDVVFIVTNSPTHTRASAFASKDDIGRGGVATSYDGHPFIHCYWHSLPGIATIHVTGSTSLTGAHEFCHAFSSYPNAFIADLYVDGSAAFNRKSGRPIPSQFAEYAGKSYATDMNFPYPAGWKSYHSQREDANNPALMDNFWTGNPVPNVCRNDEITSAFILDRLAVKVSR